MSSYRNAKIAIGFVGLGIVAIIVGFICLLMALTTPEGEWTKLLVFGSLVIIIGFLMALIAALYLTLVNDSDLSPVKKKSKKLKPVLGAFKPVGGDDQKKYPPLSDDSKERIYKMTLNLGSVDIRTEKRLPQTESATYEEPAQDHAFASTYEAPGLADGTKQFKD